MANTTWTNDGHLEIERGGSNRKTLQFVIIGIVLIGAISLVVYNAINAGGTRLYLTVNEYLTEQETLGDKNLRVSGWVIGESITYTQIDAETSRLEFDIVDDLSNPTQTLRVVAWNEPMPDLLQHEAQALVEGRAGDNGEFVSNEGGLLLKCPTRYEESEL